MLGLKLNHASKRDPWPSESMLFITLYKRVRASTMKDFNFLCHFSVARWDQKQIRFYVTYIYSPRYKDYYLFIIFYPSASTMGCLNRVDPFGSQGSLASENLEMQTTVCDSDPVTATGRKTMMTMMLTVPSLTLILIGVQVTQLKTESCHNFFVAGGTSGDKVGIMTTRECQWGVFSNWFCDWEWPERNVKTQFSIVLNDRMPLVESMVIKSCISTWLHEATINWRRCSLFFNSILYSTTFHYIST